MNTLFSRDWFLDFYKDINENSQYEKAAETWEGDILFVINGDSQSWNLKPGINMVVRFDLFHGKCRDVEFFSDRNGTKCAFLLEGAASVWESLIHGQTDLVSSVLKGKIRVEGNIMKLMRYIPAAEQLINSARKVSRI